MHALEGSDSFICLIEFNARRKLPTADLAIKMLIRGDYIFCGTVYGPKWVLCGHKLYEIRYIFKENL